MNKYSQQQNESANGKVKGKFVRTNWKIKARMCRLIEPGKEPRILSTKDAIAYAESLDLDLVEISYDYKSDTSVCKVCDYGKFMYEQKQREKIAKKQAKANQSELKTVQMSLTTDTADLNRMIEHAKQFLNNGDRVKISLKFRGRRELQNISMGRDIMKSVLDNFDGLAMLDASPVLNGKELSCILRRISTKN